jgi:hypothetical protein
MNTLHIARRHDKIQIVIIVKQLASTQSPTKTQGMSAVGEISRWRSILSHQREDGYPAKEQ